MRVHLIAIGGAVMHNLAIALKTRGYEVTGSDDEIFEPSASRLARHELLPEQFGWYPDKITSGIDAVILGMHARADNPELAKALSLKIPVYSFPEFVFEQSRNKLRVVICGSHGKTTITSMIMHVLQSCQKKFDYLVGAQLDGFETMVQFSDAPVIIIEGDEYFASPLDQKPKFLHYHGQINVITGIAWDHFNVFPTFEYYIDQFRMLITQLTEDDILITNDADDVLQKVIAEKCRAVRINYDAPDYETGAENTIVHTENANYHLSIFGRHNMQNMEAAKIVCEKLNISHEAFYNSMQTFKGAARRLEVFKKLAGYTIFRDFAHAPSKVKATVDAVRERFSSVKLIACLELHTYSSLNQNFIPQYAGTMKNADISIVYINPHALEMKKLPPLSESAVRNFFADEKLIVITDANKLLSVLKTFNDGNSNFLLMSSGNFNNLDFNELT